MGTGGSFPRGKVAVELRPVLKLGKHGALAVFPLHAFMACTQITLHLFVLYVLILAVYLFTVLSSVAFNNSDYRASNDEMNKENGLEGRRTEGV
jgi:hypothetical protein